MNRVLHTIALLIVWIALWGDISWANLVSGIILTSLVLTLTRTNTQRHAMSPIGALLLIVDFLSRLAVSTYEVSLAVLFPTPQRLQSGIVTYELSTESDLIATIMADAISLTPGTLTLEVTSSPKTLSVHVLGIESREAAHAQLEKLEHKVLRAVRPLTSGESA